MNTSFKSLAGALGTFAPTLATMLGGPLAGAAVSALAGAFGLKADATASDVTDAMKAGAMTPEIAAAVRKADQDYQVQLAAADYKLKELNADADKSLNAAIVADVADARKAGSGNWMVMWIGVFILLSFLIAMVLVLMGCWAIITGSFKPGDAGTFGAVTGLVGAIVGYFASNAQVVINYLYGGSLGGRKNAEGLADATKQLGTALGKAAATPTP